MTRRAIEIEGTDVVLELSKVTRINHADFKSIHIDKLDDGTYRMIYSGELIEEIKNVEGFKIIRED